MGNEQETLKRASKLESKPQASFATRNGSGDGVKVNLRYVLQTLAGADLIFEEKPLTIGITLANLILSQGPENKFSAMKAYLLALKFQNDDFIELDVEDATKMKGLLEADSGFNMLVRGQILSIWAKEGLQSSK